MISVPLVQDLVEVERDARNTTAILFKRLLHAVYLENKIVRIGGNELDVARARIGLRCLAAHIARLLRGAIDDHFDIGFLARRHFIRKGEVSRCDCLRLLTSLIIAILLALDSRNRDILNIVLIVRAGHDGDDDDDEDNDNDRCTDDDRHAIARSMPHAA